MRILYIATNFTALTHSFITREIANLRRAGVEIDLLSLRTHTGDTGVDQPECDLTGCRQVYPVPVLKTIARALREVARRPGRMLRAVGVALVSPGDSPRDKAKLLFQLGVTASLVAEAEAARIDHIHAHFATSPTTFALFLHLLTGIPFSFTGHAADIYRNPVALVTKLRHAAGIVAISAYNLRYYRSLVSELKAEKIIHCGIDPAAFPFRERRAGGTPLTLLAVGRAVPKKGFRYLIEALALLDEAGIAWRCDLVGDGPLLEEHRALAERLGLERLRLRGPLQQPEVRRLLQNADAFVLPCIVAADGDRDGIPVALMEAMATGCPVVTTRVSGIPELVDDGRSGLLVEPGSANALAAALQRLVTEPGLAPALSRGGRDKVLREFNLEDSAQQLRAFFERLSASRSDT